MSSLDELAYHENALLGSVLLNPLCFPEVREYITTPDCFSNALNALVFRAMDATYMQHGRVDEVLLFDRMMADGKQGVMPHIAALTASVPTSANVQQYAEIVFSAYQRRVIAQNAKVLTEYAQSRRASSKDIEARVNAIVDILSASMRADEKPKSMRDLAEIAANRLCDRIENRGMSGLPTGIHSLDRITHGLEPGMHVVAACTSVGKTAFALNVARNVCRAGKSVLFVSLEMGVNEVAERMLMMVGGIDSKKLDSGFLGRAEAAKIPPAVEELSRMDFRIVKPPCVTPSKLRAIIASECIASPPALVVLDYIQLMNGEGAKDGRQVEVAACSRAIKLFSGEFGIPIMALSQLNRDAADPVPRLHHIRESGAIEQDADTVLMLHREDDKPDELTAALRKGRGCGVGAFKLHYNKSTQVISEFGAVPSKAEPAHTENVYEDDEDF